MSATPSAIEAAVPEGAVLLGQRDELAVGAGAGGPPGVGEQHEREQTGHLGIVGQRRVHAAGEADGLARQVGAGEVRAACWWRSPR